MLISLKAAISARSLLLIVRRFWYLAAGWNEKQHYERDRICACFSAPLTAKRVERRRPGSRPDHCRQIAAAQQRILRTADTRRIDARLFVAERAPLGADIDDTVADNEAAFGADHVAGAVVLDQRRVRMRVAAHPIRHFISVCAEAMDVDGLFDSVSGRGQRLKCEKLLRNQSIQSILSGNWGRWKLYRCLFGLNNL